MDHAWPIIQIAINVTITVIGFLLVRWLIQTIRIAILELKEELRSLFATKEELRAVKEDLETKIGLAKRVGEVGDDVRYVREQLARRAAGGAA